MRLAHWVTLIGLLVGLGCLQVAQRNALFLQGYAIGERMGRVHTTENDVAWLNMRVVGLASPTHLSQVAQERRLNLVAWSTLSPVPGSVRAIPAGTVQGTAGDQHRKDAKPFVHIAAAGDTSD